MSQRPSPDFFEDELTHLVQKELQEAWQALPPPEPSRMATHRAAFIAAGVQLAQQAKWLKVRLLTKTTLRYAAIIVLLLMTSFVGARAVSAQSLPGDRLYPVKLSLESVDMLFYGGEQWEARQEERRLSEVLTMVDEGEQATVSFIAVPTRAADGQWYIGTVPLVVSSEQSTMLSNQCQQREHRVQIYGEVRDGTIIARAITPGCFYVASR
jgi:hypothetical protein